MTEPLKIGVLLSGSGTNLQAIIDAAANDGLPVDIVQRGVVTARRVRHRARARRRASRSRCSTATCMPTPRPPTRASWRRCARAGAEYVVMAGYMRKVTPVMLDAFPDRVLNLHPALLPSFKGAHAIQRGVRRGREGDGRDRPLRERGLRQGRPSWRSAPWRCARTTRSRRSEARIHEVEHELYPEVLRLVAEGRVGRGRGPQGAYAPVTRGGAAEVPERAPRSAGNAREKCRDRRVL